MFGSKEKAEQVERSIKAVEKAIDAIAKQSEYHAPDGNVLVPGWVSEWNEHRCESDKRDR